MSPFKGGILTEETKRPDIKPESSLLEKIVQIICPLLLLFFVIQLFTVWGTLPQKIPSHFNAAGAVDGWDGKGSLLFLPILGAVFYVSLTVLERFPKIYNFPFNITEENAGCEYQIAREMLVFMKAEILIVFAYIQWAMVEAAKGGNSGLGLWFLPVFLILLFGTSGFEIFRMYKHKSGN